MLAQKDLDARWAVKNEEAFYGYKDHVKVGAKTKLILRYEVTAANTHDSQMLPDLVIEGDSAIHADAAYVGATIANDLREKGVNNYIHEKRTANAPLTEKQQQDNQRKSKTRVRVEHTFAFMENSLGGIYQRCIGRVRNEFQIGLINLCYNLCRCC